MDPPEKVDQVLSFCLGKAREGLVADLGREFEDPGKDRTCFCCQDQPVSPTVSGIGPPLDPTVLLHTIDLSHQSHWLDFKQIRKAGLVDTLVASEIPQHFALGSSKTEKQKGALVKASCEQASDVVYEKSKAAIEVHS